jgi:hypothetical protein
MVCIEFMKCGDLKSFFEKIDVRCVP